MSFYNLILSEGVELQEYLTHDAYFRNARVIILHNSLKSLAGAQIVVKFFRTVASNQSVRLFSRYMSFNLAELPLRLFSYYGGMIELGNAVAVEHGPHGHRQYLHPVHFKCRLIVLMVLSIEMDMMEVGISRINQSLANERNITAGSALTTRLRHRNRTFVGIVASTFKGFDDITHNQCGG